MNEVFGESLLRLVTQKFLIRFFAGDDHVYKGWTRETCVGWRAGIVDDLQCVNDRYGPRASTP